MHESLRASKRKYKILKDLKFFGVSKFLFWAIESIQQDGNDGKFKIPHFSGK